MKSTNHWIKRFGVLLIVAVFWAVPSFGSTANSENASLNGHYVKQEKSNSRVIVFVHGLHGDAQGTWQCDAEHYWPGMISTDKDPAFSGTDIYVASYPTPLNHSHMTVADLETVIENRLEADGVFSLHKEVVFVAHSLGGILVQQLLLTYRDKDLYKKVPFIYLYATPQEGSKAANLLKIFSPDPLLKELMAGDGNFVLPNMRDEWIHAGFDRIKRYCAYETQPIHGFKIVDRNSATAGCQDTIAINANHITIVKPCDLRSDAYTALLNKIKSISDSNRGDEGHPSPPISQNCPGGICIAGPNSAPLTVYNDEKPDPPARGITRENGVAAVAILKEISPGPKIGIKIVGVTPEIDFFARQLLGIFTDAKWEPIPQPTVNLYLSYETPHGFQVDHGEGLVCYHNPQPNPTASTVIRALAATGYPCRELPSKYAPDIEIMVGTRFPPKQ